MYDLLMGDLLKGTVPHIILFSHVVIMVKLISELNLAYKSSLKKCEKMLILDLFYSLDLVSMILRDKVCIALLCCGVKSALLTVALPDCFGSQRKPFCPLL